MDQAEIISPEDIQHARDLANATDELSHKWGAFEDEMARAVIPALAKLAGGVESVITKLNDLANAIPGSDGSGFIGLFMGGFNLLNGVLDLFGGKADDAKSKAKDAGDAVGGMGSAADTSAGQVDALTKQLQDLASQFRRRGRRHPARPYPADRDIHGVTDRRHRRGHDEAEVHRLRHHAGNDRREPGCHQGLSTLRQMVAPGSQLDQYLTELISGLQDVNATDATATVSTPGAQQSAADVAKVKQNLDQVNGYHATASVDVQTRYGVAGGSGIPFVPPGFPHPSAAAPSGSSASPRVGATAATVDMGEAFVPAAAFAGPAAASVVYVTNHWPAGSRPADVIAAQNRWANTRGNTVTQGATGI